MYRLRLESAGLSQKSTVDVSQRVASKERYRVNLPLHMAECEANYHRLDKLLFRHKDYSVGDSFEFAWLGTESRWVQSIEIIERSRYTITMVIGQKSLESVSPWLQMPRITVRMYHDAKVAEVLAWEGHKRLRPRYTYPNTAMYQADEKFQINAFLGEWLSRSLERGISIAEIRV